MARKNLYPSVEWVECSLPQLETSIEDIAWALVSHAKESNRRVSVVFNGLNMVADPDETVEQVLERAKEYKAD